jgi:hypothetical protein
VSYFSGIFDSANVTNVAVIAICSSRSAVRLGCDLNTTALVKLHVTIGIVLILHVCNLVACVLVGILIAVLLTAVLTDRRRHAIRLATAVVSLAYKSAAAAVNVIVHRGIFLAEHVLGFGAFVIVRVKLSVMALAAVTYRKGETGCVATSVSLLPFNLAIVTFCRVKLTVNARVTDIFVIIFVDLAVAYVTSLANRK